MDESHKIAAIGDGVHRPYATQRAPDQIPQVLDVGIGVSQ